MSRICPVCNRESPQPPHGVCGGCHGRFKAMEVLGPGKLKARAIRDNPDWPAEEIEKRVQSWLAYEQTSWERLTEGGISATLVAVAVVDAAPYLPTVKAWQRRRVGFLADVLCCMPDEAFAPATRQQVNAALQAGFAYWGGEAGLEERAAAIAAYRAAIGPHSPGEETKYLPLRALWDAGDMDFLWEQYVEGIWDELPEHILNDEGLLALLQQHFGDVIQAWCSEAGK